MLRFSFYSLLLIATLSGALPVLGQSSGKISGTIRDSNSAAFARRSRGDCFAINAAGRDASNATAPFFEAMQQWIHCSRTEPVAMSPKFFDHLQIVDRFSAGMIQDVEPNEAGIQLPVSGFI